MASPLKSAVSIQSSRLEELIRILKKDSPKSELMIATVHNIVQGKLVGEVFTNGWTEFSAVVCQYSDPVFGWYFLCYASNCEDLSSLLYDTKFVEAQNWIMLVEDVHVPGVMRIHNLKCSRDDVTTVYHLPQSRTLNESSHSSSVCPDGFALRRLEERHAEAIASSWMYSDDKQAKTMMFQNMIRLYHCAGIFSMDAAAPDEPVAWCMQYPYGPLAHLYVTEACRKRGFATLLVEHVMKCIRDDGLVPQAIVDDWNVTGKKLMEKLGLVEQHKVTYLKSTQ